ncbi:hypothetical protein L602_000800001160 [Cupriavidus gilardii J11]|uniref:Uncharacterized protein n=1 Tax=Cupriavidus gilardii J11 TaxID=936133 RepID=A0A562B1F7_9BURK|nr:hypothetical protein [Cupriavidus gilardii]TWG79047.1 hypothetical protein L602_000800001160 [Cupriavidus gilardii J11]
MMKSLTDETIINASRQWIWETLVNVAEWSRWEREVIESRVHEYILPYWTRLQFTHTIIGNTEPYRIKFQARFRGPFAIYYYWKLRGGILRTMKNALNNLSTLAHAGLTGQ